MHVDWLRISFPMSVHALVLCRIAVTVAFRNNFYRIVLSCFNFQFQLGEAPAELFFHLTKIVQYVGPILSVRQP